MSRSEQIERAAQRLINDVFPGGPDNDKPLFRDPSIESINTLCDALALPAEPDDRDRRIAELEEDLRFVERWANHHGRKPTCTPEAALATIQHYPPIKAITKSYEDGVVPDTPDPWARIAELEAQLAMAEASRRMLAQEANALRARALEAPK